MLQAALMLPQVAVWSCSVVQARAARVALCRCALPMPALPETVAMSRCAPVPRVLATQVVFG